MFPSRTTMRPATAAILLAALSSTAYAQNGLNGSDISIYWGQNSYGQGSGNLAQQPLATYCSNADIDIIPMAFLLQITTGTGGAPVINFANQGNDCSTFEGTELLDCPQIGDDIVTCQRQYGKKILLSIGGATYTEGGFSSEQQAIDSANMIWQIFGPPGTNASALRPFGDAVVDGFDFDFESPTTNTVPFANTLRSLMNSDSSKTYLMTAAPQCPFPDANMNNMLSGGVDFDAVWVQYYNNYCGIQSYVDGASTQNNFNFETWDNWAHNTAANKNVKVFLGIPAGPTAAGSGYVAPDDLQPVIDYTKTFSSFGGVMAWDASQAYANNGFLQAVRADVS